MLVVCNDVLKTVLISLWRNWRLSCSHSSRLRSARCFPAYRRSRRGYWSNWGMREGRHSKVPHQETDEKASKRSSDLRLWLVFFFFLENSLISGFSLLHPIYEGRPDSILPSLTLCVWTVRRERMIWIIFEGYVSELGNLLSTHCSTDLYKYLDWLSLYGVRRPVMTVVLCCVGLWYSMI